MNWLAIFRQRKSMWSSSCFFVSSNSIDGMASQFPSVGFFFSEEVEPSTASEIGFCPKAILRLFDPRNRLQKEGPKAVSIIADFSNRKITTIGFGPNPDSYRTDFPLYGFSKWFSEIDSLSCPPVGMINNIGWVNQRRSSAIFFQSGLSTQQSPNKPKGRAVGHTQWKGYCCGVACEQEGIGNLLECDLCGRSSSLSHATCELDGHFPADGHMKTTTNPSSEAGRETTFSRKPSWLSPTQTCLIRSGVSGQLAFFDRHREASL